MENKIDGAMLVFVDVDAVKRGLDVSLATLDYAQSTLETVREPLFVRPTIFGSRAPRSYCTAFGATVEKAIGRFVYAIDGGRGASPS